MNQVRAFNRIYATSVYLMNCKTQKNLENSKNLQIYIGQQIVFANKPSFKEDLFFIQWLNGKIFHFIQYFKV